MRVFLSSFLVLFALLSARGVELSRLVVDDDAIEPESQHARFTSMLAQARDQLESATEERRRGEALREALQREHAFHRLEPARSHLNSTRAGPTGRCRHRRTTEKREASAGAPPPRLGAWPSKG